MELGIDIGQDENDIGEDDGDEQRKDEIVHDREGIYS